MRVPTTREAPRFVKGAAVGLLLVGGCYQLAGFDDWRFRDETTTLTDSATTTSGTSSQGGHAPTLERIVPAAVRKLDLLVVLDNSPGMADKHRLASGMLDTILGRLVNPRCVHLDGASAQQQPEGPDEPCPEAGSAREFPPLRDLHVGVLSSSLGGHGSDSCDPVRDDNPRLDDRAHLLSARADGTAVDTYRGLGFLAWDPDGTQVPAGESDAERLATSFRDIIGGVGESGCPFEAPLESWYRFLVDPAPYGRLTVVDGKVEPAGVDGELLAQRAAFLRADSSLAIVVVSDENDCSIQDRDRFYLVAQQSQPDGGEPWRMPRARSECETDAFARCCLPCGAALPSGCSPDGPECATPLPLLDDPVSLRCFEQRRRFGADFLYEIQRYSEALGQDTVTPRVGQSAANPIIPPDDAVESGAPRRHQGMVALMSVVGVPWQDVARRIHGDGSPDLNTGANAAGEAVGGLLSGAELEASGAWRYLLNKPTDGFRDALTLESIDPREGTHPILDVPVAPPESGPTANPINGHERLIPDRDDLQYTCVYDGIEPLDCSAPTAAEGCACATEVDTNPLCQAADGTYSTTQSRAGAYPGLRQLELTRSLGARGLVASTCPAQSHAPGQLSFELTAAAYALVELLGEHLKDQYCIDRELDVDPDGAISCRLFEATGDGQQPCSCPGAVRQSPDPTDDALVSQIAAEPDFVDNGWSCLCELRQVADPQLYACQNVATRPVVDEAHDVVDGWCYLDSSHLPPLGDPSLMPGCHVGQPRALRLLGESAPRPGAGLFLWCP